MDLRREYGYAVAAVAAATAVAFVIYPFFSLTNLVMIYLLGTVAVAARGRRGPAAVASFLSVLCFDFFFVPPRFTFRVSDIQYVWTFIVMFVISMVISHLTIRLREEAEAAREGEQRTTWLMEKAKKAEVEVETERLRSSLLSSVSHDFRTPLTVIVGSASALLKKDEIIKNQPISDLVDNIQTEGERLSRLVQNILEVSRLEAGAVRLQKELYPLEEMIGSAIERLEKALVGRKVHTDIPESLPLVPVEGLLIEQVFINLLENAVRHTPPGSAIDIAAEVQGPAVHVSISDRGLGLKEADVERVFEKFYHDPASPGAGFGLAICRAIVQAHGGTISASNRAGGGAVFTFTIPLEETHGR